MGEFLDPWLCVTGDGDVRRDRIRPEDIALVQKRTGNVLSEENLLHVIMIFTGADASRGTKFLLKA